VAKLYRKLASLYQGEFTIKLSCILQHAYQLDTVLHATRVKDIKNATTCTAKSMKTR